MVTGWKTTEFWLTAIAVLAGSLMSSGLLLPDSTAMKITGLALAVLSALGYGVQRTALKAAVAKADAEAACPPKKAKP